MDATITMVAGTARRDGAWVTPSYPGERFWHRYEPDVDLMERRASFARSIRRLREMKENQAARSLAAIAREMCR